MLTYEGLGYSAGFVRNFDLIIERVRNSEEIEVMEGPDDICAPLLKDKSAVDMHCHIQRVKRRDKLALNAIGYLLETPIVIGSRLRITPEILKRMREAFHQGAIRSACLNCPWATKCTEVAEAGFKGVHLDIDTSEQGGESDQR